MTSVPEPAAGPLAIRRLQLHRYVTAEDVLAAPSVLTGYPHRYVVVGAVRKPLVSFQTSGIPRVLEAVEVLEARGWELVDMDLGDKRCTAILRRAARGA